jgi:hypothetical protein
MQNRSILDPTIKIRVVKYLTIVQVASSKFPLIVCVLDRDRERERGKERERERVKLRLSVSFQRLAAKERQNV